VSPDAHDPVPAAPSDVDPGVPVEVASRPAPAATRGRWRRAAVYRIPPASFGDADGDGVGALAGIASHIPYLRDLGIDAVRLDVGASAREEIGALAAALHAVHLGLILDVTGTARDAVRSWAEHDVDAVHVDGRLEPVRDDSGAAGPRDVAAEAFDVDLTGEEFEAAGLRRTIEQALETARVSGTAPTWMLSGPDAVRHVTRFAFLPGIGAGPAALEQWLLGGGDIEELPVALGLARARAASLFVLALPGCACLLQGEELGLQEVGSLPSFGALSVEAEAFDPGSTLTMYRAALAYRAYLAGEEPLDWVDTGRDDVLHVRRGAWNAVLHTGVAPYPMPDGRVLLASRVLPDPARIPADTAVWILGA